MSINFHDAKNKMTYTTRVADQSWIQLMKENINFAGKEAVDIGCGGGIYSKALALLNVKNIIAVDFSKEMLKGAAENCKEFENITFLKGDAYNTNLPSSKFDIVLERALIHHLNDLNSCFLETHRILKKDGILIVQDRTPDDCLLPGDENHLRGYFFEQFPKLIEIETARRYHSNEVITAIESNGFEIEKEVKHLETRCIYENLDSLSQDLLSRSGRSILHELTDQELQELVHTIQSKLANKTSIVEKDRWTVWIARKK